MARRTATRGTCAFCGREMTRAGMSRHLASCPDRQQAIAAAPKGQARQQLWHLSVRDAWRGDYWLHLEMNGRSTLDALDNYLRAIWLECCGHLSEFTVGGWTGEEIGMGRRAQNVFEPGVELMHLYDFGTTSYTSVRAISVREGAPLTKRPILLMARNNPITFACQECGQPATRLCIECVYDNNLDGTLCDEHAANHPHDAYGPLMAIVNSPRMGMCGYDGPAEPPY